MTLPFQKHQDEIFFQCPFCKSPILKKNVKKHLKVMHNEEKVLKKYVECEVCEAYILKHKYTPHLRKEHGVKTQKELKVQDKSTPKPKKKKGSYTYKKKKK